MAFLESSFFLKAGLTAQVTGPRPSRIFIEILNPCHYELYWAGNFLFIFHSASFEPLENCISSVSKRNCNLNHTNFDYYNGVLLSFSSSQKIPRHHPVRIKLLSKASWKIIYTRACVLCKYLWWDETPKNENETLSNPYRDASTADWLQACWIVVIYWSIQGNVFFNVCEKEMVSKAIVSREIKHALVAHSTQHSSRNSQL